MSKFRWFLVLIAGFGLLLARNPDILLHAGFQFEEGKQFYIGTYFGSVLSNLFTPIAGYIQLTPWLVAYFTRLFPLNQAPFIEVLVSLLVTMTVAAYIVRSRMAALIPSLRLRLALATAFLVFLASFSGESSVSSRRSSGIWRSSWCW